MQCRLCCRNREAKKQTHCITALPQLLGLYLTLPCRGRHYTPTPYMVHCAAEDKDVTYARLLPLLKGC